MIKLYQFPKNKKTHNFSPFCLKVETYLKLAGINFEIVPTMNPAGAPKKKFPYIEDQGKKIPDSSFIIDYLKNQYGDALDKSLSAEQKAQGRAIQHLLEYSLNYVMMYSRWFDDAGWKIYEGLFFAGLPFPMDKVIPGQARKGVRKFLTAQGTARHSRDELYSIGKKDIDALSELLGKKPFFLGDSVSSVDCSAFGVLNNIIHSPASELPLQQYARTKSNLTEYVERMNAKYAEAVSL